MRRWALICLLPAVALARPSILDRVAEAYRTVQGYQIEAVQGDGGELNTILIEWSSPNRLLMQNGARTEITFFHDNGVTTFRKSSTMFTTGPAGRSSNDAAHREQALVKIGYAEYSAIKNGLDTFQVVRRERLEVEGQSIPCTVVEAVYPHKDKRTFWVDDGRFVVLREVHGAHVIEVRRIVWNENPPESHFRFPVRDEFAPPAILERCGVDPAPTHEAQVAHLAGSVLVALTIEADGTVSDPHVAQGMGLGLDELAVACVAKFRYRPALKDGTPRTITAQTTVNFRDDINSNWQLTRVVFEVGEGERRPEFVKTSFPPRAQGRSLTARAVLHTRLTIGMDGVPRDVQVETGKDSVDPKIIKQTVQMIGKWRFRPGQKDVPARFDFNLRN